MQPPETAQVCRWNAREENELVPASLTGRAGEGGTGRSHGLHAALCASFFQEKLPMYFHWLELQFLQKWQTTFNEETLENNVLP